MATGMFSGVPSPNRSVLGAKQLQRPADPYLRQQYPEVYGALGGFMGMAPDEMSGSIFDPNTARVRAGAEYGFPVGTALQVAPLAPMLATGAKATARALGPTAVGMGERYLQRQGLMPGVVEGESAGMLGGPIKPQAPVSELGFYSATEQAALNLPRKSGTGDAFLNDLMKGQDVKKDELSWMGLDDYLKGKPNVTRQEVQDFISNNRVDVRERQLSGKGEKFGVFSEFNPDKNQFMVYGEDLSHTHAFNTAEEADNFVKQFNSQIPYGPSKYDSYQLPGGENYREILLTLPINQNLIMRRNFRIENDNGVFRVMDESGILKSFKTADEAITYRAQETRDDINKIVQKSQQYQSGHFNEPNILAHMRVNDRVDADGKKMLLIEEIQSDWHQAGREKGYQSANSVKAKQAFTDYSNELANKYNLNPEQNLSMYATMKGMKPEEVAKYDQLQSAWISTKEGVPDAPFKDTWHQLALKRALKYAADNGYDRVGLTTGRQQAERYNLAKQVDYIDYVREGPDKYRMAVVGKDGQGVNLPKDIFSEVELKSYLGNDVAKRIVNGEGSSGGGRMTLRGTDLQVGGEGMKKYYDEIYPSFLAKQGKKYNAKTGEIKIKTGNAYAQTKGIPAEQSIRYIDISPEMRGSVKKGQPLFTAAPIGGIGLGAGTQDNEMPDAVRQYMADPRYSDPFADTTR